MTPAKIPKPVTWILLAPAVNGTTPVLPGGFVLPTTVPKVVAAPIGLLPFAPVVGVGVAATGAGDPAVRITFEPLAPAAAGTVAKPA